MKNMALSSKPAILPVTDDFSKLDALLAQMGGLAEDNLGLAFDALERRDPATAEGVVGKDKLIDGLENQIEQIVFERITRHPPDERELRHLLTALRIASDLERVGDLAKNIAKRSLAIAHEPHPKPLITGLSHMVELALRQLKEVLDAYAIRDAEVAHRVWLSDDEIDDMYNSLFRELLTYMMEDPRNIGTATHLLFGAKNLERVGDHTTNIAENIHLLVVGEPLPEERPKRDQTSTTLIGTKGDER